MIRLATPAAGMQWLIIDFTEPSAFTPIGVLRSPNTAFNDAISVRSPSGMPVPCASTRPTLAGSTPEAA